MENKYVKAYFFLLFQGITYEERKGELYLRECMLQNHDDALQGFPLELLHANRGKIQFFVFIDIKRERWWLYWFIDAQMKMLSAGI